MTMAFAISAAPTAPTMSPAGGATTQHPATRACAHDLLLSYVMDYRPLTATIEKVAKGLWGRPRMIELWCGTGRLAWHVLAPVPTMDYLGVDPDAAMVRAFRRRTIRLATRTGEIRLEGPWDPSNPSVDTPDPIPGGAHLVLVAHAFQGLPVVSPPDGGRTQLDMLRFLRSLVDRDGTVFVIEEVFGSSADEEEAFEWAADLAARRRLLPKADEVAATLDRWGDARAGMVRQLNRQPGVIRELRASVRRFPERNRLPLATWYRMAEVTGFHLHATAHPDTPGLHLLALAPADRTNP